MNPTNDAKREQIIEALQGVYDPEIPVSIYELGLIYTIDFNDEGHVKIDMTLTTPHCPVAQEMPGMVEDALRPLDWVKAIEVQIVWEPPWDKDMMSEAAKLELNMF